MNGEWGTIDDSSWDQYDASVVCRQLGYNHGGIAYKSAYFGKGIGSTWFADFNCVGNEDSLLSCSHSTKLRRNLMTRMLALFATAQVKVVDILYYIPSHMVAFMPVPTG
ncbi:putative deleted in malignant brain tumors 1 protein-like [Apostichopus japonicus]|uniref:Putative deleted in malignant brain tumors 1 protein-like n=1 Tax=Stichopus japonicus TaxID=307972 RepID=A0A2G8JJ61_STIJA|nr:putative deleted in malignant brain tumors 1 protein-like [Apostichopus japonicus]